MLITCTVLLPVFLFVPLSTGAQNLVIKIFPGADVQATVNANPENTTFVFQPGTYRFLSIQPKNGDSFVGLQSPLLSGARILADFKQVGNLWVAGGQTQQGQQNGYCDPQHPMCTYPEDLYFDNIPLLHVSSLDAVGPGSWYFDYPNHNIYFADNPTGHLVETSVTRSAFSGPVSNVTITGFTIEKYAVPAQFGAIGDQYPGPNWTVTNNEIRWNHGAGISLTNNSKATLNYVHHNGQKGIGGSGSNVLVQSNKVSFNNWAGFDPSWEAAGMKFAGTSNLIVRGNSVHDNVGSGIWCDIDCINTLYESNVTMRNSPGSGIQHEISYAAVIRYNIACYNSPGATWLWGSQILIQNSQNVQVYGNTVEVSPEGGNGIGIIQQDRGTGAFGLHSAMNNSVHNNTVIYRGGTSSSGEIADYDIAGLLLNGNNLFDYNSYYLSDPGWYHWLWAGAIKVPGLIGMQALGQELHGTASTAMPTTQCLIPN